MNNTYFIIDGNKYIVSYKDNALEIYKLQDNKLIKLTNIEKEKINNILNRKNGYEYNSEKLTSIINANNKLEHKEYLLNFLKWLENIIPLAYRQNFYDNLSTLTTKLNIDLDLTQTGGATNKQTIIVGGYNTRNNTITMNKEALLFDWKVALTTDDPQAFYWRTYAQNLLHELTHMASSRYDKQNNISLCGFDTYPPRKLSDKNRGLTEGYTEIISMAAVTNTIEVASAYFIECCLVNQLMLIVGLNVFQESYFGNKGTTLLEEELCKFIDNKSKAFKLFRYIEINYQLGNSTEKQNILSNIQQTLLHYLDKKLEILSINGNFKKINEILHSYENMIITSKTLELMQRNPDNYDGITDNMSNFQEIKRKYSQAFDSNLSSTKK